jgi:excinuclease ABC subunit C
VAGPDEREDLVAQLAAVLQREPAAVARARDGLAALRDRASQELAFERAASIQAELKAVEWVVASQRVTASGGGDLAIHGWADGVLVSFTVRAGRMCEWEQRRCSGTGAAARVAATPVGWAPFAQRNAELAAALSRSR